MSGIKPAQIVLAARLRQCLRKRAGVQCRKAPPCWSRRPGACIHKSCRS